MINACEHRPRPPQCRPEVMVMVLMIMEISVMMAMRW
jgi:hypothetical protein